MERFIKANLFIICCVVAVLLLVSISLGEIYISISPPSLQPTISSSVRRTVRYRYQRENISAPLSENEMKSFLRKCKNFISFCCCPS